MTPEAVHRAAVALHMDDGNTPESFDELSDVSRHDKTGRALTILRAAIGELPLSDDELVPVTRGTLRRWAWMLDDSDGGGRAAFPDAVSAVEQGVCAVLAANAPGLGRRDSSPDPEGAVAREVAPDSDTAGETG